MTQPEKSYSGDELRDLLREAAEHGFGQSGEGWNGEFPDDAGIDEAEFQDWLLAKGLIE